MRATLVQGWEPLFWSVFDRSRNPMVLLDRQRYPVKLNAASVELVGYPESELLGRPIDDLLGERTRDGFADRWSRLLADGRLHSEADLVRADGRIVSVEYAAHTELVTGRRLALFVALHSELGEAHAAPRGAAPDYGLTAREREIAHLLALGLTGPEIAERLVVSPETVRTHVRNAMEKVHARTRAQLVAITMCHGLIAVP